MSNTFINAGTPQKQDAIEPQLLDLRCRLIMIFGHMPAALANEGDNETPDCCFNPISKICRENPFEVGEDPADDDENTVTITRTIVTDESNMDNIHRLIQQLMAIVNGYAAQYRKIILDVLIPADNDLGLFNALFLNTLFDHKPFLDHSKIDFSKSSFNQLFLQ